MAEWMQEGEQKEEQHPSKSGNINRDHETSIIDGHHRNVHRGSDQDLLHFLPSFQWCTTLDIHQVDDVAVGKSWGAARAQYISDHLNNGKGNSSGSSSEQEIRGTLRSRGTGSGLQHRPCLPQNYLFGNFVEIKQVPEEEREREET